MVLENEANLANLYPLGTFSSHCFHDNQKIFLKDYPKLADEREALFRDRW